MKTWDAVYQEWQTEDGQIHAMRMGLLIRCKDCKHCLNYCRIIEDRKYDYACALKEEYGYPYGRFRVNENDFCSKAERKEE